MWQRIWKPTFSWDHPKISWNKLQEVAVLSNTTSKTSMTTNRCHRHRECSQRETATRRVFHHLESRLMLNKSGSRMGHRHDKASRRWFLSQILNLDQICIKSVLKLRLACLILSKIEASLMERAFKTSVPRTNPRSVNSSRNWLWKPSRSRSACRSFGRRMSS